MDIKALGEEVAPSIFIFDNFIDNHKELIDLAMKQKEDGNYFDASIFGEGADTKKDTSVRNTKIIDISPTFKNDVDWWLVAQKMWKYGDMYGIYHNVPFSRMEHPQFLHYEKGEGFYKEHMDSHDSSVPRVFSSVLYLNTVEEGGETYFSKFNISVKPVAGRLVMFPAAFSYIHGAKIPISNDKFAIVTWFNP